MRVFFTFCLFCVIGLAVWAQAPLPTRAVHGVVTDHQGHPVAHVAVKLENQATELVRSYITQKDGTYEFHDLNANEDYQLRVDAKQGSARHTLTRFDTSKNAVVNLQLQK